MIPKIKEKYLLIIHQNTQHQNCFDEIDQIVHGHGHVQVFQPITPWPLP
jgi:hypothetical protein